MNDNNVGIYIHIPFCVKKCNYCDFLSFPVSEEIKPAYVNALIKEISIYGKLYGKKGIIRKNTVSTVFIGGGTPSIMESKYIYSILNSLMDNFDFSKNPEITIECNPGTLNLIKLSDYRNIGINRLSIGLQSASDSELAALGRIHRYAAFAQSFKDARRSGFDNINIDIMSALPGQSEASYTDTLNKVLSFRPEHISAYSLIIEEGTPFFDIYNNYSKNASYPPLPDEDTEREMYYKTEEILGSHGYSRYEISNYSLPGRECIHNTGYWTGKSYIGFGLGSSSYINHIRYKNICDFKQYINTAEDISAENAEKYIYHNTCIKPFTEDVTILSEKDSISEFMFLGLRMMKGIKKANFKALFNKDIYSVYGVQLDKLKQQGLICDNGTNIFLTPRGIDVSNYVFSDFLL